MNKFEIEVPCNLTTRYYSLGSNQNRCYLILHGYQHNARKILLDLEDVFSEKDFIIAPDAPFPVPRKINSFANLGLAWCFESPNTKKNYINANWTTEYLVTFIKMLNLSHLPMTVIGFSQGGMVGFKLADHFENIDTLIGLSTLPLHNEIETKRKLNILGIHGTSDSVFSYLKSKEQFEILEKKGHHVQFYPIMDMDHQINDNCKKILSEYITK